MRTEMYMENSQLDLDTDTSSLITFSIAELQDFASRSTSWSKTITLPGTDNNNKIFGHIFQVGQSNQYNPGIANIGYNFNASKSAFVTIFQDNIQTFKGGLRLLQINIDKGRKEYEVGVTGDLAQLNVALSSGKLEDLDFSAYNQTYSYANIVASWDNAGGSGVYFPLIDYGTYSINKHDWDIRTFRPALYTKEYIDKMFDAAGFRYDCALFNSTRFKHTIIPHNQKQLQKVVAAYFDALLSTAYTVISDTTAPDKDVAFTDSFVGSAFSIDGTNQIITYTGLITSSFTLEAFVNGAYYSAADIKIIIQLNGVTELASLTLPATGAVPLPSTGTALVPFTSVITTPSVSLNYNDQIVLRVVNTDTIAGGYKLDMYSSRLHNLGATNPTPTPVQPGDNIIINDAIPKNVRQIDFFLSVCQLWNLYVYEDRFDNRLIHIAPYVDFYSVNTANAVDWTYKLDRDGVIKIKPMSELNSKIYNFNYTSDSDYYNDLYSKRYGQDYGSYIFDSEFEFTDQENTLELVFSPTVLVGYDGEDKLYSTIFSRSGDDANPVEDNTDSNVRIIQSKKITGVDSWSIKNGSTSLGSTTDYGYAGHFNDPDAPSDDLNFGALQQLFFVLVTGNLSATQFNIYWSPYMAEITDKDSKLMTGAFYLTPKDIFGLDFSKYVNVDGVLFRLNKIIDYNMSTPATCNVELLKVINSIY